MNRLKHGSLLAAALLLASGCIQIETRIKMLEDGTTRVTERVQLSQRLLDLAGGPKGEYAKLLSKERLLERVKDMGEGVTLMRHDLRENGDGSLESVAELAVQDLNTFRYASPWPTASDYAENGFIKTSIAPCLRTGYYNHPRAGQIVVNFAIQKGAPKKTPPAAGAPAAKAPTPRDDQVYRDIAPVIRDTLKGFHLRVTFESYAAVHSPLGVRGSGATAIDLLDVSDADLDQWGGSFFENEEVMLELARWNLVGTNVLRHVEGSDRNLTVPVFMPMASWKRYWTEGSVAFAPSRALFEKHLAGKSLDFAAYLGPDRDQKKPARYEDVGWQGWKEKRGDKQPAAGNEGREPTAPNVPEKRQ